MKFQELLAGTGQNESFAIIYKYVHGEGGTARIKAKNDMQSTVQRHIHTQAYTEWMFGRNFRIFGMQVG